MSYDSLTPMHTHGTVRVVDVNHLAVGQINITTQVEHKPDTSNGATQ